MSTLSMTVSPNDDLSDAVELMTSTAAKSLPVVERGRVVGVVSRSDVVRLLARSDEQICGEIDELLRSADLDYDVNVEHGLDLEFVEANAEETGLPDSSFDLASCPVWYDALRHDAAEAKPAR